MKITSQRFTAVNTSVHLSSDNTTEIVLLHGWGMSSLVWQDFIPALRQFSHVTVVDLPGYGGSEESNYSPLDDLLKNILTELPEKAIYIGYSLGGMITLQLAYHFPERVRACITLASNLRFVSGAKWPHAMPTKDYQNFQLMLTEKPTVAIKRFIALQCMGAEQDKKLIKTLKTTMTPISEESLLASLSCLEELDNTEILKKIIPPVFCIFGENDQLVPVAVIDDLDRQYSLKSVVMKAAPHCFFVSHKDKTLSTILSFLQSQKLLGNESLNLDKQQVARSFSRAAHSYDSVAELQRQVGESLLTRLPKKPAEIIVDLGCGTGYFSPMLAERYPKGTVIGLDLAEGMVSHALSTGRLHQALCADAESLPLADQSVDIIYSSLAIQWCENNPLLFTELFRVLKPGGHCVFSTLGPATLGELRSAWQQVDSYVHVNQFVDWQTLESALENTDFTFDEHGNDTEQIIVMQYDRLQHLTRELKSLGAHNVNHGRPSGLTGKRRVHALIDAYEKFRNESGKLPASYQVWYQHLMRPEA